MGPGGRVGGEATTRRLRRHRSLFGVSAEKYFDRQVILWHFLSSMGDYETAWSCYRRRRNQFLLALVGWFPVGVGVGYVTQRFPGLWPYSSFVGVLLLVSLILTGSRLSEWPCPRCREPYFTTWWFNFNDPFIQRCVHCGLPKYSSSPNSNSQ